jgi:hypothetical protein
MVGWCRLCLVLTQELPGPENGRWIALNLRTYASVPAGGEQVT